MLRSHHARGLTSSEAVARKVAFGPNLMTAGKQHGLMKKVWDQVANILVVILLAAAIVAGVLKDWVELGFIGAVAIINVVIGVVRESTCDWMDLGASGELGASPKLRASWELRSS